MRFRNLTLFSLAALVGLFFSHPVTAQAPFFSEDFGAGIPADWTNLEVAGDGTPTSVWLYTTVGPTGPFDVDPLASTTADNGWMLFDSDLNCSSTGEQDAWLISSAIDAADKTEVYLEFQTFYRRFNDNAQVRVGTDLNDLDSWDTYDIFAGVSNNDFGGLIEDDESLNPQIISIDVSSSMAGQSEVYFAFQFLSNQNTIIAGTLTGCAYSWQVDDVALYDFNPLPANDLVCSVPTYGTNYATPEAMADSVFFIYTVRNAGLADQNNVQFTVTVEGDNGAFFVTQETMDVFPALTSDTIVFEEAYVPEGQGVYTVTYTVAQDEVDAIPGNNAIETEFLITEDLFAKDTGGPLFAAQPGGLTTETYELGSYYPIPFGGYEAFQIDFAVQSDDDSHIGEDVNVWLYQFQDDGTNQISDATMVPVGFANYTFAAEDVSFEVVSTTIEPLLTTGDAVELEEESDYFVMIEFDSDNMRFVYSTNAYPYGQLSTLIREGSQWFTGFTGGGITCLARMRIRPIGGNSVLGVEQLDAQVKAFPNPAADHLTARVELPEMTEQLEVRIIDMFGKTHQLRQFDNFRQDNFEFDTSALPAGTYYLHLQTNEGVRSERFVIQR